MKKILTDCGIVFLFILILTALGSIVLKETTNKLDIQTAAGVQK